MPYLAHYWPLPLCCLVVDNDRLLEPIALFIPEHLVCVAIRDEDISRPLVPARDAGFLAPLIAQPPQSTHFGGELTMMPHPLPLPRQRPDHHLNETLDETRENADGFQRTTQAFYST